MKKFLLISIVALSLSHALVAQPQVQTRLSGPQNPLLKPEDLHAQYMTLFMQMNAVPMVVWDFEGGLIAANDAYFKLLGYTREEFQRGNMDWATVTPQEYLFLDQRCIEQLKSGSGVCAPYVKEYMRKDGSRVAVKLWNARAPGREGKNIAIILPVCKCGS